jgi:uncharacterized protein (DUF983 family)
MNFDNHQHVAARTHRHGLQTKQYAPSKGYAIDKGPQCRCSECRRMFYRRALNAYGKCQECTLTTTKTGAKP